MQNSQHLIHNPIIPGFYPDPTICRVGDDFYLACSSFELCPGIPVFHSEDLAHWEQISNALTPENGFHVTANIGSGGIMAPTLRYQDGTYYIVCANFADRGNFYVTAQDPAGPWSAPQWITDIPDIDCSLFFDTNGKSYLVSPGNDPSEDNGRAFFLTPYDLKENHAAGERKKIWNSAMRKAWAPEAPHLYHIGDWYYLMIAEGGTEHFHSVCIARSKTIDGWYEGYAGNPVMTHRNLGWSYPIDNVGHADFVDTPSGNWYAVMLGSRIIDGQHKNLGRETYLCPVTWERDWPIFSPGSGKMEFSYPADPDLPWTEYPQGKSRMNFDPEDLRPAGAKASAGTESVTVSAKASAKAPAGAVKDPARLPLDWVFWGTPYQDFWRIENSRLHLRCLKRPFAERLTGFQPGVVDERKDNCVSFLARRQTSVSFEVSLSMAFTAQKNEAAGLVIQQAANHQYRLEQIQEDGVQTLRLVRLTTKQKGLPFLPGYQAETTEEILAKQPLGCEGQKAAAGPAKAPGNAGKAPESPAKAPGNAVILKLTADRQDYSFFFGPDEDHLEPLYLHADGALINPEEVGGMIGTMIGMFASGNGEESGNEAAFDWFELKSF